MTFLEVQKLFIDAGFKIKAQHQIENQYWPVAYVERREADPWWLVDTQFGQIKIGKRKHVVSISWEVSSFCGSVTSDDVTQDDDLVHAWSPEKAQEYLTELCTLMATNAAVTPVKLTIMAHSRDCNHIEVTTASGTSINLTDYTTGYVPLGMCIGGSDDLELQIDVVTGQILNWNASKVKSRIQEIIGEDKDA